MKDGLPSYWCLDKSKTDNPYNGFPKDFFQQKHLYSIELLGKKYDDIERRLFDKIDHGGFDAIDSIVVENGWTKGDGHQRWQDFMEYMNAQKIRTPKGLDWLKANLEFGFDHNNVLVMMQTIRHLYCVMWTETIWEIVSAKNSDIKFIVSDNPVTFYHSKFNPESSENLYPNEPLLTMVGTQTIFPLSLDYCLIMTHRQMAIEPDSADILKDRINARFYDDSDSRAIFSFEDMIYGRTLNDNDVCILNYILKTQAKRYIAAARKEWLFPEIKVDGKNWEEFYKLLIPPKEKVTISRGIFLGHKDGSVEGFDSFGQRITDPKEIAEIKKTNVFIKKYTRENKFSPKLTELLNKTDYPSIQEQNTLLLEGITDIFEIENSSFEILKKNFSADKVRQLYLLIEDLWPAGTDVFKMLSPDNGFNLIYSGEMDLRIIPRKLLNLSLYFDKVYITSPFPHPCYIKDLYNPIIHPEQYLMTTYNAILSIIPLIPWIATGQAEIIPNPFALDFAFREITMNNIQTRKSGFDFNIDEDFTSRQMIKQFEQILFMASDERLERTIRNLNPSLTDDLINEISSSIRWKKEHDPLLWLKSFHEIGPQMLTDKMCENLETMLYLAHLTNAIPYSYLRFKKDEIEKINTLTSNQIKYDVKLLGCGDGVLVKALKDSGVCENIREALRKLKKQPVNETSHAELKQAISESEKDWEEINKALEKLCKNQYSITNGQISLNTGKFSIPPVNNHLQKIFSDKELSDIEFYITANSGGAHST